MNVYNKSLLNEHRKIYILRDINYFAKCLLVGELERVLQNFVYVITQKPMKELKPSFIFIYFI